jgi:FkbM family methyltransferase
MSGVGHAPGRYGTIAYWDNDVVLGAAVKAYGEWFEREVDVFRLYCTEGDTVADVGANIGTHSMALARLVGPQGRVIAVEPQRPMFMLLCANAVHNGYLQIEPHRVVAGPHCVSAAFARADYSLPGSFGSYNAAMMASMAVGSAKREVMNVVTLDYLGCHKAKLIKIDVEGMEADVIGGAKDSIAASHPVLYVENDRIANSPNLIRTLRSLDYKLYWHIPLFFNEQNYAGNQEQLKVHELGMTYSGDQHWVNGASINLLCLPKSKQLPLPADVIEVGSETEHPCLPQHWDRLLGHLWPGRLSNDTAA